MLRLIPILCTTFIQLITSTVHATQRPPREYRSMNVGRLWTAVSNFGTYGDPMDWLPTFHWPGSDLSVYYLFEGRLWIGAEINDTQLVSHADYGAYEWSPSEGSTFDVIEGDSAIGTRDIVCTFDDWNTTCNDKPLGLQVHQRVMGWSDPEFCDFIIVQHDITYYKEHAYYPEDSLNIYVAILFDADVGGEVSPNCHIDDLVSYDGDTRGEWTATYHPHLHEVVPYPYDYVTIHPDGTIDTLPDGIWDQLLVWGDEPDELVWNGSQMVNDTLHIWRNFSYMYDGDNPARPGDDEGEPCEDEPYEGHLLAPGYIWVAFLYTPPCMYDSVWVDEHGLECRLPRPRSHTWWNWENDPGTDADKFAYMTCTHPFCEYPPGSGEYHCFMQHPFIRDADVFDYRFLLTYGPFRIRDHETLTIVWAAGVGYGLDGGYGESPFFNSQWYPGARYLVGRALKLYYKGATHSDPIHPSSPYEDIHYGRLIGVTERRTHMLQLQVYPTIGMDVFEIHYCTPSIRGLAIYDLTGRRLHNVAVQHTGTYMWRVPEGLHAGVYFIRLEGTNLVRKIIVLR